MKRAAVSYCIIDKGKTASSLRVLFLDGRPSHNPVSEMEVESRPINTIESCCDKYWNFVHEQMSKGILDGGECDPLDRFYDDLVSFGADLAVNGVLSREVCYQLWALARGSEVLIISTDILCVPWEALFFGNAESGSFLVEECVVVRNVRLRENRNHSGRMSQNRNLTGKRVIFLADYLEGNPPLQVENERLSSVLDGEALHFPKSKKNMVELAQASKVIHLVCHHDTDKGLKLREEVYYHHQDALTFKFPTSSLVVLTSCRAGLGGAKDLPLAARIAQESQCTVVASSCDLTLSCGLRFVKMVNQSLDRSPDTSLPWIRLWRVLTQSRTSNNHDERHVTCLTLFYSIYGSHICEVGKC